MICDTLVEESVVSCDFGVWYGVPDWSAGVHSCLSHRYVWWPAAAYEDVEDAA